MKGNIGRRAGPAPPVLAIVALLLTVATVATTSLAFAKYAARATVQGSARVAKWDVYFYDSANTPTAASTAYLNGDHREGPNSYSLCVMSTSEVAAEVEIEIRYTESDGTVLPDPVTASSSLFASYTYNPGLINAAGQGISSFGNNFLGEGVPGHGSPGSGPVNVKNNFQFTYSPSAWVWFQIGIKAIKTSAGGNPSGTAIDGCMRSYKAFVKAVQVD